MNSHRSDFGGYNPAFLLDEMKERLKLRSDFELSRALGVGPPMISKVRHRKMPLGASMLIRIHEVTGVQITVLRDLAGDRRKKTRTSHIAWTRYGRGDTDGVWE